jgi:hypothetical protein
LLAEVNNAGLGRDTTALAPQLVRPASATQLVADLSRVLPVLPELAGLLPWPAGIRRGATLSAVGSTSLLLALLAGGMRQGAWAAVVGLPHLGMLAAGQDFGIDPGRLALVPAPGPDWPSVVSALIDGVDIAAVAAPAPVAEGTVRALAARARQKSTVLVPTAAWPGSDVVIEVTGRRWAGLGKGRGRLRRQELSLRAVGRGRAAQARTATAFMPPPSIAGPEPKLPFPATRDPVIVSASVDADVPVGAMRGEQCPVPGRGARRRGLW